MDNTYLFIKIVSMLIGVGAIGKIPVNERSKWVMYIYSSMYLITSIAIFEGSYFFIVLVVGILFGLILAKICNIVQPRLDTHEAMYLQKELTRMSTIYGMASIKNDQMEKILVGLNKKYCDTNSDLRFLLGELSKIYSENNVEGNYTKLCQIITKIIPLLNKPSMVYIDRNPDMFNHLSSKADYKRAKKALKEFRDDNYFGDGFDKELAYFLELLEKGERNAINRVQQKTK